MRFTFTKQERLKSKRIIDELFTRGRVIAVNQVKLMWIETKLPVQVPVQIGVTAPKKRFNRAVDRNRIKRRMREVIRLHKADLIEHIGIGNRQFALMFLYTGNEIPTYSLLEEKIIEVLGRLKEEI
ncbi:MAG: ribonuclease P protein component [Bacteroidetes bacterium]|nr:ribonuclease P protein component [Bacteroidota bacterium]